MPGLPPHVAHCCARLIQAGFPAYPVGGCVRDLLLGLAPGDWDVTTRATPQEILALFPESNPTGLPHGTITVTLDGGNIEVTTFRREGTYSDGRHPDRVEFVSTLEEDLARRDFTINAMALSPTGDVIDLYGGQDDLARAVIRCVGNPMVRLSQDRLRIFRAIRFAARLSFALAPELEQAIVSLAPSVGSLSPQRIRRELEEALRSKNPRWITFLLSHGLLEPWGGPRTEVDLSQLEQLPSQSLPRWAGLAALLKRVDTNPIPLLQALVPEKAFLRPLLTGLELWQQGLPSSPPEWRQLLALHSPTPCQAAAWMAQATGDTRPGLELKEILDQRPCLRVENLALSGAALVSLGFSGPDIGKVQAGLLAHVLLRPEDNTPAKLQKLAEIQMGHD